MRALRRRTGAALAALAVVVGVVLSGQAIAQAGPVAAGPSVQGLKVLITNDDGVQQGKGTVGLYELRKALCAAGADVVVVAPWSDQSGKSASITYGSSATRFTLTAPTMAGDHAPDCAGAPSRGAVYGACLTAANESCMSGSQSLTPADAATLGASAAVQSLHGWANGPDVILSGINSGGNDGLNVNISGTVGAATIGASLGVPSIALSASSSANYRAAAGWAVGFVGTLATQRLLTADYVLNVNYPKGDPSQAVWTTVAQTATMATGFARDAGSLNFVSTYGSCGTAPRCAAPERSTDSAIYAGGKISIGAIAVDRSVEAKQKEQHVRALVVSGKLDPARLGR